jgi:hypothetical protein
MWHWGGIGWGRAVLLAAADAKSGDAWLAGAPLRSCARVAAGQRERPPQAWKRIPRLLQLFLPFPSPAASLAALLVGTPPN